MEKGSNFTYWKVIGVLALLGVLAILGLITVNLVRTYFWALVVVIAIIALIAAIACIYVFYWIRGKIRDIQTKERLNDLMLQEREVEIDAKRHAVKLEYQKIDIARQNVSWMAFKDNEVLAVRDRDGGVNIQYIPERVERRIEQIDARGEVLESVVSEEIEGTVLASDMMQQYGRYIGKKIMIGMNGAIGLIAYEWEKMGSVLILGVMGGGKTNTASWIVGQETENGARVALIDKHARSEQSTYYKLNKMQVPFATAIADKPMSALRVVEYVESEYERRLQAFDENDRLLLVIDEFTALMRSAGDKEDEWHEAGKRVRKLIEVLNSEGRKYGINVVCMGQAANASRSGGTEVRDLFKTIIAHGMRKRQAQMLGLTEEKHAIERLDDGEVYVDIEGKMSPFYTKVPLVDESYIASRARSTRLITARSTRSTSVPMAFIEEVIQPGQNASRTPVNAPRTPVERIEPEEERVLQLLKTGASRDVVIAELWGARRGGSEKYQKAKERYGVIVEKLQSLGLI